LRTPALCAIDPPGPKDGSGGSARRGEEEERPLPGEGRRGRRREREEEER
jgi:hypothetical protein